MTTLEEAIKFGEGIERPFRCHKHEDRSASASVNVVKGVWCCYACGAAGSADGKKAPSASDLAIMLEPEQHARVYPDAYLELFANELGNFAERFPRWLRWFARLGADPFSGDATFPVRTAAGKLAGVGRRKANPDNGQRYAYPPRWAASRSLFVVGTPHDVLVLVEGAADACAIAETGALAAAMYGSGLHKPQIDLVMRMAPKMVVIATDADAAGQHGAQQTAHALEGMVECVQINWQAAGGKDPADVPLGRRIDVLAEVVVAGSYGRRLDIEADWAQRAVQIQNRHHYAVEEA